MPYGDPRQPHYRKNAFDAGEDGMGKNAHSLKLGCDCVGHVQYFDAHFTSFHGSVCSIANAVCMHEEDFGLGWKHVDWHNGVSSQVPTSTLGWLAQRVHVAERTCGAFSHAAPEHMAHNTAEKMHTVFPALAPCLLDCHEPVTGRQWELSLLAHAGMHACACRKTPAPAFSHTHTHTHTHLPNHLPDPHAAALAAAGGVVRVHSGQLRVRIFLPFVFGWPHRVRGEAHGHPVHYGHRGRHAQSVRSVPLS